MKELKRKPNTFESNCDEVGARAKANQMAEEFSRITGIKLQPADQSEVIDSPMYGWSEADDTAVLSEDAYARFTFLYNTEHDYEYVYIRPTDETIVVWRSLSTDNDDEGAVNPATGICEWYDELSDCAYTMSEWINYRG